MVIVFDLDDTLFPEAAFTVSALAEVGRMAEKNFGWEAFGQKLTELHGAGRRRELFQSAVQDLGYGTITPAHLSALLDCFREHRPSELPWYPDALEAVRALHARFPLELISDGYLPTQRNKAKALRLERWIPLPVFTEDLGRQFWKPSLKAYELVMARHPGERFAYVADNPAKDFIAPRALGWTSIRIQRPGGVYASEPVAPSGAPDVVLSDMACLPAQFTR